MASWRRPNRNGCATGCCTSPPGSRSPAAKQNCISPQHGHGPKRSKPQLRNSTRSPPDRLNPSRTAHRTCQQTFRPPAAVTAAWTPSENTPTLPSSAREPSPPRPTAQQTATHHQIRPCAHTLSPTARSGLITAAAWISEKVGKGWMVSAAPQAGRVRGWRAWRCATHAQPPSRRCSTWVRILRPPTAADPRPRSSRLDNRLRRKRIG